MSRPDKPSRTKDKNIKLIVEIEVDVDELSEAYDKERPSNWLEDPQFEAASIKDKVKDQFHWVKGSGIKFIKVQ